MILKASSLAAVAVVLGVGTPAVLAQADPAVGPASLLPSLGITGSLAALIVVVYLFLQKQTKTEERFEAISKARDEAIRQVVADFRSELDGEREDRHKTNEQFVALNRDMAVAMREQGQAVRELAESQRGQSQAINELRTELSRLPKIAKDG